tara:strand:- start:113 stop:355 length:243 start_codon:yes stop_codon:yes gene_type:complete
MTEQVDKNVFAIPYRDRENAYIVVKRIDEPYGPGSDTVVSIGCTLKGDVENPSWKVHVPHELLGDVILAIDFAMDNKVDL